MAGLDLGLGAHVKMGNGYSSVPHPATATEAAFGPAYTGVQPSSSAALVPNDPFGIALWTGIVALGLLVLIRHSLPN